MLRIRGAALLAVILLAGTVLTACASSRGQAAHRAQRPTSVATSAAAPGSTAHRTFSPFTASGRLTTAVSRTATGHCWTSSVAAPGSNAYRCLEGKSTILDPCYAPSGVRPTTVACFADPWSAAVVLHIVQLLPPPGGNGPARAWALELRGGVRCVTSTGTVPSVSGQNLPYRCADGSSATVGGGTAAAVVARYARAGATGLRSCPVLTMWRG